MLHREIIGDCSQIHTKHINTICGQNVEFVSVKLVVRQISNIWEQPKQIKIPFMNKLTADGTRGMLATSRSSLSSCSCYPKT